MQLNGKCFSLFRLRGISLLLTFWVLSVESHFSADPTIGGTKRKYELCVWHSLRDVDTLLQRFYSISIHVYVICGKTIFGWREWRISEYCSTHSSCPLHSPSPADDCMDNKRGSDSLRRSCHSLAPNCVYASFATFGSRAAHCAATTYAVD